MAVESKRPRDLKAGDVVVTDGRFSYEVTADAVVDRRGEVFVEVVYADGGSGSRAWSPDVAMSEVVPVEVK